MPALLNRAIAHIRYEGRSLDVALEDLRFDGKATDETIRKALADYLEVQIAKLQNYVLDRHPNGNITLRPEAVFG